MTPCKGKGKAPARDNDDSNDADDESRGRQSSRTNRRQPSAEHYQMYPDHPPVLPSSINIRDFAYPGPVEQPEIPHIWAPERVAQQYAAASWAAGTDDDRGDQRGGSLATSGPSNLDCATPTAVARTTMNEAFDDQAPDESAAMGRTPHAGSLDPQDESFASWGWGSEDVPETPAPSFTAGRAQDHADDEERAPSPTTLAPTRDSVSLDPVQDEAIDHDGAFSPATSSSTLDDVPLDPVRFPFDSDLFDLPNFPEGVAAPSRCSNHENDQASHEEAVPSTGRVLRYMSSLWVPSRGDLRDGELSPRTRPVDGATDGSLRIPEGVTVASRIFRPTPTRPSLDNELPPRTQQPSDPNNANSWIPEGVAGPSMIVRPPTPQREPQRYSDIDTLMQSRNDSGQGEEANMDDALTQQVILRSLQTTAIVVNPAATEGEYGSDALENYTLPSSSEDDSSEFSEGLVMAPLAPRAPYEALRRRLSPTPTPHVSPHPLSRRTSPGLPSPPYSPTLMLYRAHSPMPGASRSFSSSDDSFRIMDLSGLPRTEGLAAERRAMERLRIYASMEDPTAQDLLAGYERRLDDWLLGHTQDHHGVLLTRRPEPSRLPHGYAPRFARWALGLVEEQRALWDLFLLSVDDDRHFVLPYATNAPEVRGRPVLTVHLRSTSVPPTSRSHADVEVAVRARSTSPVLMGSEERDSEMLAEERSISQPRNGTPSPNPAAASTSTQNTRQPTEQPEGQELEIRQVSSSRDARDSIVSTSVGTERAQSTSYLLTLAEDPPTSVPDEEPPSEVLLFLYVVGEMSRQDTRQPAAQPAGQASEGAQVGSSRDARDSIVRTSVGTGEKTDGPQVIAKEKEEAGA